ncbi:MAG: DinB family protein [Gemmataceae bacterium]
MSRLQLAIEQITFARRYMLSLLEETKEADWYRQPPGGITHIAWQVGHIAVAEHWLARVRIRGQRPGDEELIPLAFQAPFERFSAPVADPAIYPNQTAIRAVLDRVHEQTLRELPGLEERDLDEPVLKPHRLAKTKLWSLLWCAQHEAVHAGQIGLLRRQLGYAPVW